MASFLVAGITDCTFFAHVNYICDYLSKNLPDFKSNTLVFEKEDWKKWLKLQNKTYGWHHKYSPIIWKETAIRGKKVQYIGGISEFWEYCSDYYSLESKLSKEDVRDLMRDHLQYYTYLKEKQIEEENSKRVRHIIICNPSNKMLLILISSLLEIDDLYLKNGLTIQLYFSNPELIDQFVFLVLEDSVNFPGNSLQHSVQLINSLEDALATCDLLIFCEDLPRNKKEHLDEWLQRNYDLMINLATKINYFANHSMRLMLAQNGPVCFNATVLAEHVTSIRIYNIVAVTADVGLEALQTVSHLVDVPLCNLGAPPVWGFIGLNQYINIGNIVERVEVMRPYQRAIKNKGRSTLSQGEIHVELRLLEYLTSQCSSVWREVKDRKQQIRNKLGRAPCMAKVRSITDLVKFWYSKEYKGNVISLGIYTDGAFGFPPGFVFSQPAVLVNGFWRPCIKFPEPKNSYLKLQSLISLVEYVLKKFNMWRDL